MIEDHFDRLEKVLYAIRCKKNEKFSTADKELLDILMSTALEEVLQEFFTRAQVPLEDQKIITQVLTIECNRGQIRIYNNQLYYHADIVSNQVILAGILEYDSTFEDKIKPLEEQANKKL